MLKNSLIAVSGIVTLVLSLAGGAAHARVPFVSSDHQPTGIADDSERLGNTSRFVPVPNFPSDSIEFISDGVANPALMQKYLKPETINVVSEHQFNWLQIRDVRIDKQQIQNVADGVVVPVIVGVRYMQIKNIVDGTVNGLFHITNKDGKLHAEYVNYDDNVTIQAAGRIYSGIDFKQLLSLVAGDTLQTFFNDPGFAQGILSIRP